MQNLLQSEETHRNCFHSGKFTAVNTRTWNEVHLRRRENSKKRKTEGRPGCYSVAVKTEGYLQTCRMPPDVTKLLSELKGISELSHQAHEQKLRVANLAVWTLKFPRVKGAPRLFCGAGSWALEAVHEALSSRPPAKRIHSLKEVLCSWRRQDFQCIVKELEKQKISTCKSETWLRYRNRVHWVMHFSWDHKKRGVPTV